MKKVVFAVAAVAVALMFALPSFADNAAPKDKHYTGVIKAVDAAKGTITVTDKNGADKDFTVGDKTKISTADKKTAMVGDLKIGDKVKIVYTDVAGKITVKIIAPAPVEKPVTPAPATTTK